MKAVESGFSRITVAVAILASVATAVLDGQGAPRNSPPLPTLPQTLFTSELQIRVSAVATGLAHPWSLAFLPDPSTMLGASGSMLVTERTVRFRIGAVLRIEPAAVTGAK